MHIVKKILRDVSYVCELMEKCEDDIRLLRLYFVLCVTLLRTVGHVLDKVASEESRELNTAISKWWRELKQNRNENAIFFNFIEKERNLILKEYETNIREDDIHITYGIGIEMNLFNLGGLYRPLADTSYSDEDIRDIISDCIRWWNKQLNVIGAIINDDKV